MTPGVARAALLAAIDEFATLEAETAQAGAEAPPSDGWSLSPAALRFLASLVRSLEPRHVLEFGSGLSTCALGRACEDLERSATVLAIENDPLYVARARSRIADEGLQRTVRVLSAPIVVRRCHDRNVPVYLVGVDPCAPGQTAALGRPDLVLIDGPPLILGGREGALYQALHAAHVGTVVVLDDSRRESERNLLVRMLRLFDGRVEAMDVLGFEKGLAVLLVIEPISADEFPRS
jgi:hypothetical protein